MWVPAFLVSTLGLASGALLGRSLAWHPLPLAGLFALGAMLVYGAWTRRRTLHREATWAEGLGSLAAGFALAPLLAVTPWIGMGLSVLTWALALGFRRLFWPPRTPS